MQTLTVLWKKRVNDASALCGVSQRFGFATSITKGFLAVDTTTRVGDTMELDDNVVCHIEHVPARDEYKGYDRLVLTQ